jgi:integrase
MTEVVFTEGDVKEAKAEEKIQVLGTPRLYLVKNPEGVVRYLYRYPRPGPQPINPQTGRPKSRWTETSVGKPGITLNKAREIAAKYAELLRDGIDPQEAKKWKPREEMTFGQLADQWIEDHKKNNGESWLRNVNNLLKVKCKFLENLTIIRISPTEIKKALASLNQRAPKQADRAYDMIGSVLGYGKDLGYPMGQIPARKENRRSVLPGRRPPKVHYAAMTYEKVPTFIQELRQHQERSTAATALEIAILTACRTSEVLKAEWSEFPDLEIKRTWIIPPERMKTRSEHRVPVSDRFLELLRRQKEYSPEGKFVFTGYKRYQPLADKSMLILLKKSMGRKNVTVHGFRSAFRVWCAERNDDFNSAIAVEMCLAHTVGEMALAIAAGSGDPAVIASYLRTTLFDKRRTIMDAWAKYIS